MSFLLDQICEHHIHKFNPMIAEGVAVHQLQTGFEYVHRMFQLVAESFPPGLEYVGYKKCTVQEEYQYLTHKRNNQHQVELAPSDVVMVNYYFRYNGEDLPPKPIFLPFVRKAGKLYRRGKQFTIVPVLADPTLSVSKGDIFVPFLSAKVTFKRTQYWFKLDGQQKTEYLVYAKIYNFNPAKEPRRDVTADLTVKCKHTMAHYLFGKYGLKETFKRFYRTDVELVEGEVDTKKYPPEKYAVCSSSQIKPRGVKTKFYTPTEIKLIIPRDQLNNGTLGLISGFFCVLDHYPDRFKVEWLDGSEDEIRLWRVMLGHVIFRNRNSEGELFNKICAHYESLDHYVDDTTRLGLEDDGYIVNNLYDLMAILIFDFTEILLRSDPASMYGKTLAVNRYVYHGIVKAMSLFRYKVISIKNKVLDYNDINKQLNRFLKPDLFFKGNGGATKHNEIVSIACAGDNIMFNYTSHLVLQERATGKEGKNKMMSVKDPSKLLHPSIAVAGSILALPKASPTGRTVLNPYLNLGPKYDIRIPAELKPQLDYIESRLKRK